MEDRIKVLEDYVDGRWVFTVEDGEMVVSFRTWRDKNNFLNDLSEARKSRGDMRLIFASATGAACVINGAHQRLEEGKEWKRQMEEAKE